MRVAGGWWHAAGEVGVVGAQFWTPVLLFPPRLKNTLNPGLEHKYCNSKQLVPTTLALCFACPKRAPASVSQVR